MLYVYDSFDPETLAAILELVDEDAVALDAGANIGCVAVPLAHAVRAVYAFEPTPATHARLSANLTLNGCTNATPVLAALGSRKGRGALISAFDHRSVENRVALDGDVSAPEVEVATIDDFCKQRNLQPNLVKIDVEGAEWEVLRGAAEILTHGPRLVLEANSDSARANGFHPLDMLDWLGTTYGYVFRAISQTGLEEVAWSRQDRVWCNVVGLVPQDSGLFERIARRLGNGQFARTRFEVWPHEKTPPPLRRG
jgi:FkbM family methyltransferase